MYFQFLYILFIGFLSYLLYTENNIQNNIQCPNITAHNPLGIHDLHINNIDIIIALGDSITAGFGIRGLLGFFNEYRGRSWSIGGDIDQLTLPNIIKYYNPYIKGFFYRHTYSRGLYK